MTSTVTPEEQSGIQPRGLWFKLPTEIRLEIYELMFPRETVSFVTVRNQLEKKANANCSAGDYVAILATCRTIHDEAKPVLYANTHFDVSCSLGFTATLQRPVDIHQARTIDLNIELTRRSLFEGSANICLNRLTASLSTFANLQKIHIRLWSERRSHLNVQIQANYVLDLLARLKDAMTVTMTMAMDISLEGTGFDKAWYYKTLHAMGVSDKTQENYANALAALSGEQENATHEISILSEELVVRSSELRQIKKDVCWSVRPAPKARADELDSEIQAIVDDIFKSHDKAEMAKRRMHELVEQRQLLLG